MLRRLANLETATVVTASIHGIYFNEKITTIKVISIQSLFASIIEEVGQNDD
jgi:hypothetical protein